MGDPRIDEASVIHTLQQEVNDETLPYLQQAALAVILDLYDRKVERAYFSTHCGNAITMYTALAKLRISYQTLVMLKDGTLSEDTIMAYCASMGATVTEKSKHLVGVMKDLMQCPTSLDKVH
jgi:hypothetical protein